MGKNQVRKADTGNRARRARTQDRRGGEVGLAVLATRAGPNGKESVADTGDCARRARTHDRKGGEVGLAVLATRAEPSVRGAKGAKMDILAQRWTK